MDNSKYEAVLIKVQMACPELEHYETVPCPDGMVGCCVHHQRKVYTPARLSHVLRAILAKNFDAHPLSAKSNPRYWQQKILDVWDLAKDDLSLQSAETIDFLFKILCE